MCILYHYDMSVDLLFSFSTFLHLHYTFRYSQHSTFKLFSICSQEWHEITFLHKLLSFMDSLWFMAHLSSETLKWKILMTILIYFRKHFYVWLRTMSVCLIIHDHENKNDLKNIHEWINLLLIWVPSWLYFYLIVL